MIEQTGQDRQPESYVRINIAQNSKGFTYETTVSYRWNPDEEESARDHLMHLLAQSCELALREIVSREGEAVR